jgi:hypothetical protein
VKPVRIRRIITMNAEDRITTLVAMLVETTGYDDDTKERIYDLIMSSLSSRPEGFQILVDNFSELLTRDWSLDN